MTHKKRMIVVILVILLLGTPLALAAAAGETAVPTHTPSLSQTAVRAVLPYFAGSDCDHRAEAPRPTTFDMAQPVPNCWLVPNVTAAHD